MLPAYLISDLTTIPHPDTPPTKLATIGVRSGTSVTVPMLDKRSAKTTFHMRSRAGQAMMDIPNNRDKTLQCALRVRYCCPLGRKIVFHGPVLEPYYDYDTGLIEVSAIGPEDRLATAYAVDGDMSITNGVLADGRGYKELLYEGQNRPNQDALNWASLGIVQGYDTATHTTERHFLTRGDNLWEQGFIGLSEYLTSCFFEFEPIDTDPANTASGSVTDATDYALTTSTSTFTLTSSLPGIIAKMRVGLWLEINGYNVQAVTIKLKHPDNTEITLFDGANAASHSLTTSFLGQGSSDTDLLFFADKGPYPYSTTLNPITYPMVGQYYAYDGPPTAGFFQKDATGNYTLTITIAGYGGSGATLKHATLRFQDPEPAYARMNTFDPPNSDAPVIKGLFHKNFGQHNAKKMNVRVMGSKTRNQAISVNTDGLDKERGFDESRQKIGTRQSWLPTTQKTPENLLIQASNKELAQYGWPVPEVEFQPKDDVGQDNLPRFLYDYKPSDYIRGIAKRGYCEHRATMQVTEGTLTQLTGGVETTLNIIPIGANSADFTG